MKGNCFSLIKSTAHSLLGLLLIRLYVSLHSQQLGGERKGKVLVLGGRAPPRSWHSRVGLQGEAHKKTAGERHCWSSGCWGHWCMFFLHWMGVFAPGSLEEWLAAANPIPLESSPQDGNTSLMVSVQKGTRWLCPLSKILLPLRATDLQKKC